MTMIVISLRRPLQGFADQMLAAHVEGARGFVEDEHVRVLDERSGDDEPLLLPAAQVAATFADLAVVATDEPGDVVVKVRKSSGPFDLLVGDVVAKESDVVGDRAGDEVRVLRDEGDLADPLVRESTRMSRPSASTNPPAGSRRPSSNWTSVDLPLPDGPITPTISHGSIVAVTLRSTGMPALYANETSSKPSAPTDPTDCP